jgi:hypothetical protein
MQQSDRALARHPADIERQLAEAFRGAELVREETIDRSLVDDVSSRELLQMAWDKAEKELDELNAALRRLRQQFRDEEQTLLNRINQKKRLQQSLLEHAPPAANTR